MAGVFRVDARLILSTDNITSKCDDAKSITYYPLQCW